MAAEKQILLLGGEVIDSTGRRRADVRIVGDKIVDVSPAIEVSRGALVLDASGCLVAPGLVDLHTHLRQPGGEDAETIETGARAAALGGFTAVVAMPNTDPPIDSAEMVRAVRELAKGCAVEVAVSGTITQGRRGERMAPLGELAEAGVRICTDDGSGVQDPELMRRAMQYSLSLGITLAEHCEDQRLSAGGQMHEGEWSSRLGIPGWPAEAEEVMVARDLELCRSTGARLHLMHLSSAGSLRLLRSAKSDGLPVSAEVTPHHLSLTDELLRSFDPIYKVNPPLRGTTDVQEMRAALREGLIDAIATDHAPHPPERKEAPLEDAPPGMTGLETALGVAAVAWGDRPLEGLFAALSWRPAGIAGLEESQGGPVAPGRSANLCIVDTASSWEVVPSSTASRSRNTPFAGWQLPWKVRHTVSAGRAVVVGGEATC